MSTPVVEAEFGAYPDPHLDPNPCEAFEPAYQNGCGDFVPFATPLYAGKVVCAKHLPLMCGCGLSIEDPDCCTNDPSLAGLADEAALQRMLDELPF